MNYARVLDGVIDSYAELANGSFEATKTFLGCVLDVPSIEAMTKTKETLTKICDFLEVTCQEQYLQDCTSIVDPVPSKTRHNVEWSGDQLKRVKALIRHFPFLRRYSFES